MGKFSNNSGLNWADLKGFLDSKVEQYNTTEFIKSDPIQIPHRFNKKEDIEISAFITATIAWGNRKSIIKSSSSFMERMDHSPHDFVMNHADTDLKGLEGFVHRTFNWIDAVQFVKSLRHIYDTYGGMEALFHRYSTSESLQNAIHHFKNHFFEIEHTERTKKHISDPLNNSAAKRINMFLRWMVRPNITGVDFGLWSTLKPKQLSCPLDVHSGNVARKLGLLKRTQNDAKAVIELDQILRQLDVNDPVKYDFALFGLGVFEGF
ncbi:MAG: TIGR02757 family protein [Flavobacteriaceae bacterium]